MIARRYNYAMRAIYLNPETGLSYVVTADVPFDPTGEKQQPITCSTIEMKMDHARIFNQASKDVNPASLVPGDRTNVVAFCAKQPVVELKRPCEFHNDAVTSLVHGQTGLMFQGTITGTTSDAPVGSIATLFGHRTNNFGGYAYTSQNGVLNYGTGFDYVGYTEKGIALLGKPASLN